jgi:hypothetical protein
VTAVHSSTANIKHTARVPYLNLNTHFRNLCLPCVNSHSTFKSQKRPTFIVTDPMAWVVIPVHWHRLSSCPNVQCIHFASRNSKPQYKYVTLSALVCGSGSPFPNTLFGKSRRVLVVGLLTCLGAERLDVFLWHVLMERLEGERQITDRMTTVGWNREMLNIKFVWTWRNWLDSTASSSRR